MRLSPLAVAVLLLFAGFGCRTTTPTANGNDAPTYEEIRAAEWIDEGPTFAYEREGTVTNATATVALRTRPGTTVSMTLTGDGISGERTQTVATDGDGWARVQWRVTRAGVYEYEGWITAGREVVARFSGEGRAQ